jgi:hypothetical protein
MTRSKIMRKPRSGCSRPGPWPTGLESTCLIVDRQGASLPTSRALGAGTALAPSDSHTASPAYANGGSSAASRRPHDVQLSPQSGDPTDPVHGAELSSVQKVRTARPACGGTRTGSGHFAIWADTSQLISEYARRGVARLTTNAITGAGGRRLIGLTTTRALTRMSLSRLAGCATAVIPTGISRCVRAAISGSMLPRGLGAASSGWVV